jgi:CubicO group peptidase (beta-lactamase class C family)
MNKFSFFLILCCIEFQFGMSQMQKQIGRPNVHVVNSLINEYNVPTVGVAIIEGGKLKQANVFGNRKGHEPVPVNTLFNIASLTKPVSTLATLILVSDGKWSLDEPLHHYWTDPDVAEDARHKKLTTRHVLTHQSGLPNWRGHEPNGKLSFAFEPGSDWKYSGEAFEYLRQALEHKFKAPFEKLVDSLLFYPLGMNDTRFYWDASVDTALYANRHREDGSPFPLETWDTANPSNLLLTTVSDYAKFGVAVMNGFGVSADIHKQMFADQALVKNNTSWGLGWKLIRGLSNGEWALVHTGRNPGINTIVILLPESKRGIVVFTNGANGDRVYELLVEELLDVGKEIMGKTK